MKAIKLLAILAIMALVSWVSYSLGSANYAQRYETEHILSTELEKMLKMYYEYRDYEDLDEHMEPVRRYTFWEDCIMETESYDIVYQLKNGWEDFYAE